MAKLSLEQRAEWIATDKRLRVDVDVERRALKHLRAVAAEARAEERESRDSQWAAALEFEADPNARRPELAAALIESEIERREREAEQRGREQALRYAAHRPTCLWHLTRSVVDCTCGLLDLIRGGADAEKGGEDA